MTEDSALHSIEGASRESLLSAARWVGEQMTRALPTVVGALAGGSLGRGGAIDSSSDADIWLLHREKAPAPDAIASAWRALGATPLGGREWRFRDWPVELSSHDAGALEEELERLITREEPDASDWNAHWLAYTVALYDPLDEVARLQARLQAYPESLRRRIIARATEAMLKPAHQARVCAERDDWVCLWSLIALFVDHYFRALFACNRLWHPGAKRLLAVHLSRCGRRPQGCDALLRELLDPASALPAIARAERVESLWAGISEMMAT